MILGLEEAKVEKRLVKAVENEGGLCLKFTSPGMNGVPDRIVLFGGGRSYFVEVKAPGETPRPLQLKIAEWFEDLGHEVFVVDTQEDAEQLALYLSVDDLKAARHVYSWARYR